MDEKLANAISSLDKKIDLILQRMESIERGDAQQWEEIKALEKRVNNMEKEVIKHISEHDAVEKQNSKTWRVADFILVILMILATVLPIVLK
jgi:Na+/phosphate symporter